MGRMTLSTGVEGETISGTDPEIRPYGDQDLEAIYRICLATGDNGNDAAALYSDPEIIGHIYAGPYGRLSARCCLVAEDGEGVGGYILGAHDTAEFEAALEVLWWPALRGRYADPSAKPRSEWTLDEVRAWQIHHPARTPEAIVRAYPSHLHIDLLPRFQGRGVGRAMMDRWLAVVRGFGSSGAHLGVGHSNARALRFYAAYGWRELVLQSRGRTTWLAMAL